jgi:CheY-like chemotaxis protein
LTGIALSGFGTEEDLSASKAAGFVAHLTKPVDLERLRAAITLALNGTAL